MITSIVSIGNSQGIRIPKPILKESGLKKDIELKVKKGQIIITPIKRQNKKINFPSLASESVLAKDWLRSEEDEAWKNL